MTVGEDRVYEMIEKLKDGKEKIQQLKEERDKLLQSNKMLVTLVQKLEKKLEEHTGKSVENVEGFEYSVSQGWISSESAHQKAMALESEVDVDRLEQQMNEIIQTLNSI